MYTVCIHVCNQAIIIQVHEFYVIHYYNTMLFKNVHGNLSYTSFSLLYDIARLAYHVRTDIVLKKPIELYSSN